MKNLILVMVVFVLAFSVAANENVLRTVEVSGTCSLSINPDIVMFNINIESVQKTLKLAKERNDKIFKNLVTSLKESGISEENIELNGIQYSKHQEYENGKYVNKGYRASQDLTVKLKDFSLFETILSYMVENDDIKFSLGFDSSKSSAKKMEALKEALAKAKVKAEEMAAVYGMSVGLPINISEQVNSYSISVANTYLAENRADRTNLFNQVTVEGTVVVKFELK